MERLILVLPGGGMRGLTQAVALDFLERESGVRISEGFDLIAGTSTGAILGCGLTASDNNGKAIYRAAEMVAFYEQQGPVIFSRSLWRRGLVRSRYSDAGLLKALDVTMGETLFSHAATEVLVTTYEIEKGKPMVLTRDFSRQDGNPDWRLKDVALASASAPTYFPPAKIHSSLGTSLACIDGGLWANNPLVPAIQHAQKLWPNDKHHFVVVESGRDDPRVTFEKARGWGLIGWSTQIIRVLMDGAADAAEMYAADVSLAVFRPKVSASLDDASDKTIRELKQAATVMVRDSAADLRDVARRMAA
jgi:patatin-like phospholipase/acyl hydrolase